MANGLKIRITEDDFKAKPPSERDWILYLATEKIDQQGCSFGRAAYQGGKLKAIIIAAGAFGAAFASALGAWQFICR